MWATNKNAFTVVELIIVIVVIGVLAAVTLASFNGVQKRSQQSVIKSDLQANAKKVMLYASMNDRVPTMAELSASSEAKPTFSSSGSYRVRSYCWTAQHGFGMGVETMSGEKYYSINSGTIVQDNSVDLLAICAVNNVKSSDGTAASTGYIGASSSPCANENGVCAFTGVKHVIYGANGKFSIRNNVNTSTPCNNATFGDPTPGVAKACYTVDP